jgi:translation initiation factor 5B
VSHCTQGLEHAIAGTGLYVVGPDDDIEDVKDSAMEDMKTVMSRIDKTGEGVYVQASTLGSLEALLEFLKSPAVNIPVSGIGIGPVHKKDVMKASVMLEKKKEYATILAFDVKVTPEARELADESGVKIFIADIIYHLFDQFKAYIDNLKEEKKKEAADDAVFPCVLKIMPNCIFNKKDPIVLGVDIVEGIAKVIYFQPDWLVFSCLRDTVVSVRVVIKSKKGNLHLQTCAQPKYLRKK